MPNDLRSAALDAVERGIEPVRARLNRIPGLDKVFHDCFVNTLETTVQAEPGDTFVITGDIHAMWLRDSTAQVLHYLRFADVADVALLIEGLIARQAKCVLIDPYANAFNREPSDYKPYDDRPRASDWVWERKYEVDSLCYPIWLAWRYFEKTGSRRIFTPDFARMLGAIARVFRTEQRHDESPYRFERSNCPPSDTLPNGGMGAPVTETGMTWSGFRPSDDACQYGYLIPSELFAAQEMRHAASFARMIGNEALAAECDSLAKEIREGVEKFGHAAHPVYGDIYAYETDGLGHFNLMDDANVPSLLGLPYLGVCAMDDPIYQRTRKFVLSESNPYYHKGEFAKGVGSPHTPKGYIWPIALCVQAMTSDDLDEIAGIVDTLMHTHAGCECMHESFDPDAPEKFTREWFAWANSMFGELIFRLYEAGTLDEVLRRAEKLRNA